MDEGREVTDRLRGSRLKIARGALIFDIMSKVEKEQIHYKYTPRGSQSGTRSAWTRTSSGGGLTIFAYLHSQSHKAENDSCSQRSEWNCSIYSLLRMQFYHCTDWCWGLGRLRK